MGLSGGSAGIPGGTAVGLVLLLSACEAGFDPRGVWQVEFSPALDVSPCTPGLSWCCQILNVNPGGAFSQAWSPDEPETLLISGTLDEEAAAASLQCIGGTATGTVDALFVDGAYEGQFDFGGSTGGIRIDRQDDP